MPACGGVYIAVRWVAANVEARPARDRLGGRGLGLLASGGHRAGTHLKSPLTSEPMLLFWKPYLRRHLPTSSPT